MSPGSTAGTPGCRTAHRRSLVQAKDPSKRPLEIQKQVAPAKGDGDEPATPGKPGKGGVAPAKEAP